VKAFTLVVPCSDVEPRVRIRRRGHRAGRSRSPGARHSRGRRAGIARHLRRGRKRPPRDGSNRLIEAAHLAAQAAGRASGELRAEIEVQSSIPLRRGLGSSAAAALAGALLADCLLGGAVGEERALGVAARMEDIPTTWCLRCGAVHKVAVLGASGQVVSCPIPLGAPLRAALFIPDQELSTTAARAVLRRR